jgi:8-oxo-dGTP pyrophosphatase MutT (NUDIX family)
MRKNNKVAIYCAFKEKGEIFYILVQRSKKRGGFWQGITGGEEDFDNNDLNKTVIREIKEELGINISKKQIFPIPYSFKFINRKGVKETEYCFGVILSLKQKKNISLSDEHTAIIYSKDPKYLISLLKFKENKIGFKKFTKLLKERLEYLN